MTAPILILYTGGTIGMTLGPEGWQPAAGFDAQIRAAQTTRGHTLDVPWTYAAMTPPIDSANVAQPHWLAMRDVIVQAVSRAACSGVLILHGTDTLAYTAAALSFLLLGLPVPVCVTGAMHPASQTDTDAWDNLFGALQWLRNAPPGGVHVVFDGKALPGVQTTKRFSDRRDAFAAMRQTKTLHTPNTVPDQTIARLDYRVVRKPVPLAVLPLTPGLDAAVLQSLLDTGVSGLVLELYGSGTGPTDDARFLDVLRQAHRRGVMLAGISQCPCGVMDGARYAAGSRMLQCGVLPGGPMTREAALGKLFGLLGAGLSADQATHWWPLDLCGEWGRDASSISGRFVCHTGR